MSHSSFMKSLMVITSAPVVRAPGAPYPSPGERPVPPIHQNFLNKGKNAGVAASAPPEKGMRIKAKPDWQGRETDDQRWRHEKSASAGEGKPV